MSLSVRIRKYTPGHRPEGYSRPQIGTVEDQEARRRPAAASGFPEPSPVFPRARVHGEERHGRDAHDLVLHGDTAAATEEGGEGAADAGVGQLQLVEDHDGRLEQAAPRGDLPIRT